jgi:hypothetical protein
LCGGYDGVQYRKEINKTDVFEKDLLSITAIKETLPGNFIFIHNNFIRLDDFAYNFDFQMNVVIFDPKDSSFKIRKK